MAVGVWIGLGFGSYMVEVWSQRTGIAVVAMVLTTAAAAEAYRMEKLHVGERGHEDYREIARNLFAMAMASFVWCMGSVVMLYLS